MSISGLLHKPSARVTENLTDGSFHGNIHTTLKLNEYFLKMVLLGILNFAVKTRSDISEECTQYALQIQGDLPCFRWMLNLVRKTVLNK
jgi:hypothetical protein